MTNQKHAERRLNVAFKKHWKFVLYPVYMRLHSSLCQAKTVLACATFCCRPDSVALTLRAACFSAPEPSLQYHEREEPRHGGRREEEVCNEASSGGPCRN